MPNGGLTVLWFLAVLALIPLSLWWMKRSGLAQGGASASASLMRPVGQHVLGPGQKLVTMEVGTGADKVWLVLGVTAQQITTLHTLAPQAMPDTGGQPMPLKAAFAKVLRERIGQSGAGNGGGQ
jgi:flagellar protein FliO/FliZ